MGSMTSFIIIVFWFVATSLDRLSPRPTDVGNMLTGCKTSALKKQKEGVIGCEDDDIIINWQTFQKFLG